ncbi:MAG: hypothetical protein KAS72_08510 [Phycisphaerales bacterium]|nr:hypothetical protein [Phycisphaerales bacterium]
MFRQLFTALRSVKHIDADFAKLEQMLEHTHWMFDQAVAVLERAVDAASVQDALYERDIKVNKLEREIRGDLVRHLSINPGKDVAACLTLMSIAKDAERIGDYCKGVFEVGRFFTQPFEVEAYQAPVDQLRAEVSGLFDTTRRLFSESDRSRARETLRIIADIKKRCDRINTQLLRESDSLGTPEAVAYSLLARHFKRVAAHLGNICTAVFSDVERLDFMPKKGSIDVHPGDADRSP